MSFTGSEAEELKRQQEHYERLKARTRERYEYIYSHINTLTDQQLKAIGLMISLTLQQDTKADIIAQMHFYQGWVMGALGSRADDAGDFVVFPNDIFPHWDAEDKELLLDGVSKSGQEPPRTGQYV